MKVIKNIALIIGITCGLALCSAPLRVNAISSVFTDACNADSSSALCKEVNKSDKNSVLNIVNKVVNVLLYLLGGVSVIMIVVAGFRYVTSMGNQQSVEQAKNMITYAVIGLVVAIMAYSIVNFVVNTFIKVS